MEGRERERRESKKEDKKPFKTPPSPPPLPPQVVLRINCLSTEFSGQKGVKGLPLHIVVDTYEEQDSNQEEPSHRAYCRVKIFRDKVEMIHLEYTVISVVIVSLCVCVSLSLCFCVCVCGLYHPHLVSKRSLISVAAAASLQVLHLL